MFAFVKPSVQINGHRVAAGWGPTYVPLQPGRYHVHMYTPYFLPPRIGPADYVVDVAPGHIVDLEYRTPLWSFSRGSLGPPPQGYNGAAAVAGVAVGVMLIFVLALALILFAA
jgi:hypothetical protein